MEFEKLKTDSDKNFTIYSPGLMKSPHDKSISTTLRYEGFYTYNSTFYDGSQSPDALKILLERAPSIECEKTVEFKYAIRHEFSEIDLYKN